MHPLLVEAEKHCLGGGEGFIEKINRQLCMSPKLYQGKSDKVLSILCNLNE